MSARRFADARALAAVGANVSRRFLDLELRQLKVYAATSSLWRKNTESTTTTTTTAQSATQEQQLQQQKKLYNLRGHSTAAQHQDVHSSIHTKPIGTEAVTTAASSESVSWVDQIFKSPTPLKTVSTPIATVDEPSLMDPSFLATPAAHGYQRPTITTTTPLYPSVPSTDAPTPTATSSTFGDSHSPAGKRVQVNKDSLETLRRESKWLDAMPAEDTTMLNKGAAEQTSLWAQRQRLGPRMMVYEPLTETIEDILEEEEDFVIEPDGAVITKTTTPEIHNSSFKADTATSSPPSPSPSDVIPKPLRPMPEAEKLKTVSVSKPTEPTISTFSATLSDTIPTEAIAAMDSTNTLKLEQETKYEPPKKILTEASMPTSRVGRLFHYGGLAASLGAGAITETVRRTIGRGTTPEQSPTFLTPANMDRLVSKLTKMRGAALKLGQMLSIQDNKMLPPELEEVLSRVQNSANFMPEKQMRKVMSQTMGSNWESEFTEFNMVPIAAASIGQVHKAIHRATGMPVAVKVQYPGVAASIDSDLSNLKTLVLMSSILPRGMYLDNTIKVAQRELGWETDYLREAECIEEFGRLLKDDPDYHVPKLVREASGPMVLTMEWMDGETMTQVIQSRDQTVRDRIGTNILRLCLRELFEFQYMQTDPNWTNFLYSPLSTKLELLDFGATRGFDSRFTTLYLKTILAGAAGDRDGCLKHSRELGFLTGEETTIMEEAHINSLLTLSEPFQESAPDVYDFKYQTITQRVKDQIPTMLKYRLTPPPDETYSMHRKMAGAFLLCSKLGARVECKKLFRDITSRYREENVNERRGMNFGRGA